MRRLVLISVCLLVAGTAAAGPGAPVQSCPHSQMTPAVWTSSQDQPAPVFALSRGDGTTPALVTSDPCHDDCYDLYDRCTGTGCGVPPDEVCLEQCEYQLLLCLDECDSCPSTRTYTTYEESSKVLLIQYHRCLDNNPLHWKKYYDKYRVTWKKTTYLETTQCNGTKTTEVINVEYPVSPCWYETLVPCTNLDAYPGCTRSN